ncbi:MAG TPA: hypothetical protein GXX34_04660 [Clostridia bacterium]|nr:hypothetical protein [Clostridia bacterium]
MLITLNQLTGFTRTIEDWAVHNSLMYKLGYLYYRAVVQKEAALAGIRAEDKVLCIGGGPCPFTGIIIHQLTRAPVTIIDQDPASVDRACRIVHRLGLESGVQVRCQNGRDVDVREFSVIHLAMQVAPFREVFQKVRENCRAEARILVRLPKVSLKCLYGDPDLSYFRGCRQIKHGRSRNIGSTALYVKAGKGYVQDTGYHSFGAISPSYHPSA